MSRRRPANVRLGRCGACGRRVNVVFRDGVPVESDNVTVLVSLLPDLGDLILHHGCPKGDVAEPRVAEIPRRMRP